MATVQTFAAQPRFVLELNADEARYVLAALFRCDPRDAANDDVFDALHDAMERADVDPDMEAASINTTHLHFS